MIEGLTMKTIQTIPKSTLRWLGISIVLLCVATIGVYTVNRLQPKPIAELSSPESSNPDLSNPDAYGFALNLPGTTNRRQLLQREIELYQSQVQQDPQSGMNLAALASAYWKMGKATGEVSWYLLAEQTAQRSLVVLPFENASAQLILAQVAQARHDFDNARKTAATVLKAKPNNDEAKAILVTSNLAIGNLPAAKTQVDQLVAQLPNLSNLTLQALVQEAQGQSTAAETFRSAIAMEEAGEIGGSALVRVLLGRYFYQQGQFDRAAALYQEALRILPGYPLALMHLAALETRRGNYVAADQHYDQVLTYSQQAANIYDHTILRGKARLQQLQGRSDADLLQQAEKLLRQDTNAGHGNGAFGHRRELAQLLLDRNQNGDQREALTLMQAEVKIRRDATTLAVLARALMVNDRLPEARQVMQSALNLGKRNASMLWQLAQIEQRLGNVEPAKIAQMEAQKIDPTFDQRAQLVMGLDTL
jgi:tetratricopeptide (TPR) repeat protein